MAAPLPANSLSRKVEPLPPPSHSSPMLEVWSAILIARSEKPQTSYVANVELMPIGFHASAA